MDFQLVKEKREAERLDTREFEIEGVA